MTVVTNPLVQNPHIMASFSTKAAWTGLMWSGVPSPSTVVTVRPTASIASTEQP